MTSDTHESIKISFSGKSYFPGNLIFPGSQFSKEVNCPGKSNFTKDIHDVQISAIYDTQPKLMRQVMTYADDGRTTDARKHRVICSRRPDSFAAGKNTMSCLASGYRKADITAWQLPCCRVQGFTIKLFPGLVNVFPAVAYPICLNVPAVFSQPGNGLTVKPCSFSATSLCQTE